VLLGDFLAQGFGERTEMGIGAGWYQHEWHAYGYGFPGAGLRLGMLDERIQVMRQMWTEGRATLQGEHFQIDGAICRPLPLQDGGAPDMGRWWRGEEDAADRRLRRHHMLCELQRRHR
jgi:alkanesulfonate monooxygenase SsuD/methylene tetrahydromethanopterin reductase-like flavin-dependent oxidoreductase (luciferase family)